MTLVRKILRILGFKSYIKIPEKGFGDLTESDVGSMIEAFLGGGNQEFEQSALYEFRLMDYQKENLEKLKNRVITIERKYQSSKEPDGLMTPEGRSELRELSIKLQGYF